jgi:hypothetical protein
MRTRPMSAVALTAAVLLAAAALPLAALETVGEITYLEGRVEIVRDGETLAASLVKEGLALENFDLLKTASDGQAELRITSASAPAATIAVSPRTQFSLELGKVGARQQTTLDLVVGSVAMKCAKLAGSQAMRVQTETAFMGVRGTSFSVDAPASGDILVACDEGEVECTDERGEALLAAAGEAIEKPAGRPLARLAAAGELAAMRRGWLDRQVAGLKRDPLRLTAVNRALFYGQLRLFNRRYAALMRHRKTFDAWGAEDQTGVIGRLVRQLKERNEVTNRLRELRRTLFRLERTYVRLLELREYCEEQGISGRVGLLQTSTCFFQYLDRQGMRVELRRALVRRYARLYALRNEGQVPGGAFDAVDWKSFFGK